MSEDFNLLNLNSPSRAGILICLIAGLSYLIDMLGSSLMLRPELVWPLWPGCAFLVAVLLLVPRRLWPALVAAALTGFVLYDIQTELSVRSILLLNLSDVVEVLVAAFGVNYALGNTPRLNSVKRLALYLIFAVIPAPMSAAFIAASALRGNFWIMWRISFLTEGLALLTLTPAILGWMNAVLTPKPKSATYKLEALVLLSGLMVSAYFTFVASKGPSPPVLLYSLVPFLLWSALRFGNTGIATSMLFVAFFSISGAVHGRGPFIASTPLSNVVSLQLFLFVAAIPFMALAAVTEERKESAHALRDSQARESARATELRTILEAVPVGVLIGSDAQCKHITANRAGYELLRLPPGANISKGAPLDQRPTFRIMAGAAEIPAEQLPIQRAAATAKPISNVSELIVFADGTERSLITNAAPLLHEDGTPYGAVAALLDVTERDRAEKALRESEERFRLAAQAGKMYAYEWDAGTDLITRSGEVSSVMGLSAEDLCFTRQQLLAKIHPDDRGLFTASVTARTPENPDTQIRYRVLRPDGSVTWVEKTGHAFFDEGGKLIRMIGMVADISERKLAEDKLQEYESIRAEMSGKLIEAQEQERTRIARELHDDINQRLALLCVELEAYKRNPPTSPRDVSLTLSSTMERLAEISVDVQSISHQLHPSHLEYLGIIAAARSFCRDYSAAQNIEIDFTHSDIPTAVPPDVALCLFRVLQEALHNAFKHSKVRHFEVRLSYSGDKLHLTVSDHGVGFDPQAKSNAGGLGLVSMRERVRLVNGTIAIDSQPTRGTTIHVSVPFEAELDSQRAAG